MITVRLFQMNSVVRGIGGKNSAVSGKHLRHIEEPHVFITAHRIERLVIFFNLRIPEHGVGLVRIGADGDQRLNDDLRVGIYRAHRVDYLTVLFYESLRIDPAELVHSEHDIYAVERRIGLQRFNDCHALTADLDNLIGEYFLHRHSDMCVYPDEGRRVYSASPSVRESPTNTDFESAESSAGADSGIF